MEERRCMLCGELLVTDRGMICWDCVRKHQEEGNIDDVAAATFFLSEGAFGYPTVKKGGKEE